MKITITLDDEILRLAHELTGITEKNALLLEGVMVLIEREAARRLASLGGAMPTLETTWRRRLNYLLLQAGFERAYQPCRRSPF